MSKGDFDFSEFIDFVENFERTVEEEGDISHFKGAVEGVAESVVSHAKENSPRDTGELIKKFTKEPAKVHARVNITVDVVNNVDYASFVEEGHRTRGGGGYVSGVHMLQNAMDKVGDEEFPKRVTKNYEKLLRKATGN